VGNFAVSRDCRYWDESVYLARNSYVKKLEDEETTAMAFVGISHAYPHCTSRASSDTQLNLLIFESPRSSAQKYGWIIKLGHVESRAQKAEDAGENKGKEKGNTLYAKEKVGEKEKGFVNQRPPRSPR
jgi:hypothetical protein